MFLVCSHKLQTEYHGKKDRSTSWNRIGERKLLHSDAFELGLSSNALILGGSRGCWILIISMFILEDFDFELILEDCE